MADYGEVTYRGTASGNGTIYFVLASTTGGTTTYTLLGSTDIVNATISPYTTQNTFAFTAWVPTPSAGTTYHSTRLQMPAASRYLQARSPIQPVRHTLLHLQAPLGPIPLMRLPLAA